jgi:uncharacterized membrane protein YgdD (TMEM256/DUF423 family)
MLPISPLSRGFLVLGAINMALTVALGAASRHGLAAHLAAQDPGGWFQTALTYHQLHSLGLLIVGLTLSRWPASRWLALSGAALLLGIVFFSGNLYLRSLAGIHIFHSVTPIGGIAFIMGWISFAIGVLKPPRIT